MFVTPVTESGVLCHKKINFMLPSGSPRYRGLLCASEGWWHTMVIWGKAIPSPFCIFLYWPTTVGSKSTMTARGTCFPVDVSLKNVVKESSELSLSGRFLKVPSGWMPCSRQKSSQHAFPICTPAWPTCTEMHSRWEREKRQGQEKQCTLALLIPGGCIFPVYCFAKQLVSCHCSFGCSAPPPQWACTCQTLRQFF